MRFKLTIIEKDFSIGLDNGEHGETVVLFSKGEIDSKQAILDARALYPDSSLADLYDELTMPPELRKAHQQNDKAVMQAYGFSVKDMTESSCVVELMKMYKQLVLIKGNDNLKR